MAKEVVVRVIVGKCFDAASDVARSRGRAVACGARAKCRGMTQLLAENSLSTSLQFKRHELVVKIGR